MDEVPVAHAKSDTTSLKLRNRQISRYHVTAVFGENRDSIDLHSIFIAVGKRVICNVRLLKSISVSLSRRSKDLRGTDCDLLRFL